MKAILFALLVAACLCDVITREFIDDVQSEVSWEVTPYEENLFRGWTDDEVKSLLGARDIKLDSSAMFASNKKAEPVPEHYDAREKHGKCIHPVRNQANCGSCWAFGATSALSDRYCIGGKDVILSPQDLIECDKTSLCCQGGYIDKAWEFLEKWGVVEDKCKPYNMNCGACRKTDCEHFKCKNGTIWYGSTPQDTKEQMFNHGPIEAAFEVYRDFMAYKSGVYYHQKGEFMGGHAIECLGYGKEQSMEYWLCKNSWGPSWGMSGYFKIKQGDCKIDDNMIACKPNL
jgi:cathepsin B